MQSVSYMGNDETTEFYFNFPYFETSNIVVTVNNAPAPTYNIIGTPGGENADFPFVGGRVVFAVAPHITDSITISRQLPLARIADYQPFAKIEPTTLNQDLNYLMEVIKDRKDELDDLSAQYADIADKESTATLLARISAIHDEIVAIDAKITALGDISTLRTDISTNSDNIATNTNNIATLQGYDYVVESQSPTAENNYTWYRKYKSGWVEQGGIYVGTSQASTVALPIQMTNSDYTILSLGDNNSGIAGSYTMVDGNSQTQNGFTLIVNFAGTQPATKKARWYVCGFAQS